MIPLQKLIDINNKMSVDKIYAFNDGMFALNYNEPVGLVVYNYNGDQIIDRSGIPDVNPNMLELKEIKSDTGIVDIDYWYNDKTYGLVRAQYNAAGQLTQREKITTVLGVPDDVQTYDVPFRVKFPNIPAHNDRAVEHVVDAFSSENVYMDKFMTLLHGVFWILKDGFAYQLPASRKNIKNRCDELTHTIMNNTLSQLANRDEIPGLFGTTDPRLSRTYNFLKNYINCMCSIESVGLGHRNIEKYKTLMQVLDKRARVWVKSKTNNGR